MKSIILFILTIISLSTFAHEQIHFLSDKARIMNGTAELTDKISTFYLPESFSKQPTFVYSSTGNSEKDLFIQQCNAQLSYVTCYLNKQPITGDKIYIDYIAIGF